MSNITLFSFESHEIRTLTIDGNPWFVGKDVAEALGYTNPNKAMGDHCKGVTKRYPLSTAGGTQDVRIINEPDTFRLIVGSNLPEAERFERWLFEDVLPSIRKTGSYALPDAQQPTIDLAAQLAKLLHGKVIVDYEALCQLARMTRAGLEKVAEGEKLLQDAEQIGLELERQCGKPLVKLDIPADRLAHHRATPRPSYSRPATAPTDLWEPQVAAFVSDRQQVTTTLVLDYLGIPAAEQTQYPKNRIARILKNIGFVCCIVKVGRKAQRVWMRTYHA